MFGDDFTIAALINERVIALSFAAQPFTLDAFENHVVIAAPLIFTVVQRVTATFRHAFAEWGQALQNDPITAARFYQWVVDQFTSATVRAVITLRWEQIARHVFGDDFTATTLLVLRIVESMSTSHSS